MEKIIEYLELIRTSIALNDEKIIAIHVEKIKQLDIKNHDNLLHMINLLDRNKYNLGTALINKIILDEREIQKLKTKLKLLEDEHYKLNEEKNEILQNIDTFNSNFHAELNEWIEVILELKKEILTVQLENATQSDRENLRLALDESRRTYQEFLALGRTQETKQSPVLSTIDKLLLKETYYKAIKLCHPDVIPYSLKNSAEEILTQLNDAYIKKDLPKVKSIKLKIQNNNELTVAYKERISQEVLKEKISKIEEKINRDKEIISNLLNNLTYHRIQSQGNQWNYFIETRKALKEEFERLEEKLKIHTDQEYSWVQELWSWADQKKIKNFPQDKNELLQMTSLDISHKSLNRLPDAFVYLKSLTILNASNNRFSHIPKQILALNNLEELDLKKNDLEKIPKNIDQLNHLKILNLEQNKIEKLPKSLGNIKSLRELKLSYNQLQKLPDTINNLENLQGLYLKGNQLS